MRDVAVPAADVVTPNHFELDLLAGRRRPRSRGQGRRRGRAGAGPAGGADDVAGHRRHPRRLRRPAGVGGRPALPGSHAAAGRVGERRRRRDRRAVPRALAAHRLGRRGPRLGRRLGVRPAAAHRGRRIARDPAGRRPGGVRVADAGRSPSTRSDAQRPLRQREGLHRHRRGRLRHRVPHRRRRLHLGGRPVRGHRASPGIDLGGATVLPGLLDVHSHPSMLASLAAPSRACRRRWTRSPGCWTGCAAIPTLGRGDDRWIEGFGFDESGWPEGRKPTRHDLDRVSTTQPVFVRRCDSHSLVCNTRALELAGHHPGHAGPRRRPDRPGRRRRPRRPAGRAARVRPAAGAAARGGFRRRGRTSGRAEHPLPGARHRRRRRPDGHPHHRRAAAALPGRRTCGTAAAGARCTTSGPIWSRPGSQS